MTGSSADTKPAAERRILGLSERQFALLLLFLAPALFASNMLIARATADSIPPVALAFWRWAVTLLLLLPFTVGELWQKRGQLRREWPDLVLLGALGMGICGAFVYIGADTTTATNIGLIYAASPILIVVLARLFYGEALGRARLLGIALCLIGVLAVVCRGDLALLRNLAFAAGDLWILAAMIAWAVYSVLLRHRPTALSLMARFAAITGGGVLVLLPFAALEAWQVGLPAFDGPTLGAILFLACAASFGAYQCYARIQAVLGAGPTGLLMYLIPLYNGVLAFLLLGETLETYHLIGAALVLPGIYLATRPTQRGELFSGRLAGD